MQICLIICVILQSAYAPAQSDSQLQAGEAVVTVVDTDWVRLRSAPEIRPETVIGKVSGGTQLRLLERAGDWFRVRLNSGREAWISTEYSREEPAEDRLEVIPAAVRLRQSPSLSASRVGRAPQGLRLKILDKTGEWYQVRLPDSTEGWVRQDLVALRSVLPRRAALEETEKPPTTSASVTPEEPVETLASDKMIEIQQAPVEENAPLRPIERSVVTVEELQQLAAEREAQLLMHQTQSEATSPAPLSPTTRSGLIVLLSVIPGVCIFFLVVFVGSVVLREEREQAMQRALLLAGEVGVDGLTEAAETASVLNIVEGSERELAALDQAVLECLRALREPCTELNSALDFDTSTAVDEVIGNAIRAQQKLLERCQELSSLQTERLAVMQKAHQGVKDTLSFENGFPVEVLDDSGDEATL